MKNYKAVFFDFDGTLADSSEGVTRGVAYTLRRYGIEPPPLSELTCFIGPPLAESFERYYGFPRERGMELEYVFREYYEKTGIYEARLYGGICELLARLRAAGKILAVASSKPEKHIMPLLDYFKIGKYFDYIGAADVENGLSEKADIVKKTLFEAGLSPSDCLMVGDTGYDIIGAHANGMDCAAVSWGFGSRDEFLRLGADFVVDSAEELEKMLI
ncbi:MAG: HAD hydrolase-like protein [Clostridia bacterium]|nr:HAD hydrolase-like protein [Clostridia bacterium]